MKHIYTNMYGGFFNDVSNSIDIDSRGNAYITGFSNGLADNERSNVPEGFQINMHGHEHAGSWDTYVIKEDSSGNISWSNKFGDETLEEGESIAVDQGNRIFVAMRTEIQDDAEQDFGFEYASVVEISNKGELISTLATTANTYEPGSKYSARQTSRFPAIEADESGVYILENIENYKAGVNVDPLQIKVKKITKDGRLLWETFFGPSSTDKGNDLALSPDGGIVVAGYTHTYNTKFFDQQAFINKYNSDGTLAWSKLLTRDNTTRDAEVKAISVDTDGNIFASGYARGRLESISAENVYSFAMKLNPDGDITWIKTTNSKITSTNLGPSVANDGNGGAIFSTFDVDSSSTLIHLDSKGNEVSRTTLQAEPNRNVRIEDLKQDGDYLYVTGSTTNTQLNDSPKQGADDDAFVAKYSISGTDLSGNSGGSIIQIGKPTKFKKKSADKITNFNPSIDTLEIDTDSFGIDSSATFAAGKNKKEVKKKLAKQDFDFLYDQKKGGLYFNENGSDKGFGDGGIIAILKGAPDLTAENLEFI